jgi:hypothetical protein
MTSLSFGLYSESTPGTAPGTVSLKRARRLEEVRMDNDSDTVGGYAVPVDPMDLLQCDSCQ